VVSEPLPQPILSPQTAQPRKDLPAERGTLGKTQPAPALATAGSRKRSPFS